MRVRVLLLLLCSISVYADPVYRVKDINQVLTTAGSNPQNFVTLGNVALFTAGSGQWRTDGTAAGTFQLGGYGYSHVLWNNRAWYLVSRPTGNLFQYVNEIWSTDGTVAGTYKVALPAEAQLSPSTLMAGADHLYFINGQRLWRTDGNAASTVQVSALDLTLKSTCVIGGQALYFLAQQQGSNTGLWKVENSTLTLVKEFPDAANAFGRLTVANNTVFIVRSGNFNAELWRSDGTADGTYRLQAFTYTNAPMLIVDGTFAYYCANDGSGHKLWRSDGTPGGTTVLASSLPGVSATFNAEAIGRLANGTLLFIGDGTLAIGGVQSRGALWAFNGTTTTFLTNISGGNQSDFASVAGNIALYGSGGKIWRTDGSVAGTFTLADSSTMRWAAVLGGNFYFAGTDAQHGSELWKSDGSLAGTMLLKDLVAYNDSSLPTFFRSLRGGAVFRASTTDQNRHDLWFSDGTEAGTTMLLQNIAASWPDSNAPSMNCGGRVYFPYYTGGDTALWATDGTPGGTSQVKAAVYVSAFACADSTLYFTTTTQADTAEIWRSDGTAAGTLMVKRFATGDAAYASMTKLYAFQHFVYAGVRLGGTWQLWRTDGTAGGTTLVKSLPGATQIPSAVVADDALYFNTLEPAGSRLWKSDGTPAGTNWFLNDTSMTLYASFRRKAIFHWRHDSTNLGMCASDGSAPGTTCFDGAFVPPTYTPAPELQTATVNGRFFYNLDELRTTDGTTSTSAGLGNIRMFLSAAGGRLYALNSEGGALLETDGTVAGTTTIYSPARRGIASGGRMFIGADELYAYDLSVTAISFAPTTVTAGQSVTITGRGFSTPLTVTVGGVAANVTAAGAASITFTAPVLGIGAYPIALTLADQRELALEDPLTYGCAAPTAAIAPVNGPPADHVQLHGSGGARCAWFPETGLDDPASCNPTATLTGTTTFTLIVFTAAGCPSTNNPSVRVLAPPPVPTGLQSFSGPQNVEIDWNASPGATKYEVARMSAGSPLQVIGETTYTYYRDFPIPTATAYIYRVRAVGPDATSAYSAPKLASTFAYTDEDIWLAHTIVRAVHLSELRDAVNAVRALAGLGAASWSGDNLIRAANILELRSALSEACAALGVTAPAFSDTAAPGQLILAQHFYELRYAMR